MPEHNEDWTAPVAPGRARGDLRGVVDDALRAVTGWRGGGDFLDRVRTTWQRGEGKGTTVWTYAPGRVHVVSQGSSGLRGPQAALAEAAEAAALEVQAVLEELEPLRPTDEEDVQATAHVVLTLVKELSGELARPTRPRAPRVDRLLETLVGETPGDGPASVEGELGRLREQLGMGSGGPSALLADEEQVARYLRLVDTVLTLRRRWELYRGWLAESGDGTAEFLTPRLDALRRRCEVVEESVAALEEQLDGVGLGAARRHVTAVPGELVLTLQDLLDWVRRFAGTEVLRDVEAAGRSGVEHYLLPTAEPLACAVREVPSWLEEQTAVSHSGVRRVGAQLVSAVEGLVEALRAMTADVPPQPTGSSAVDPYVQEPGQRRGRARTSATTDAPAS